MKSRNGIRTEINAFYRTRVNGWVSEHVKDKKAIPNGFPIHLYLGAPKSDEEILANKEEFIKFCQDWEKPILSGHIETIEKEIDGLGKVKVPVHLVFDNPEEIVTWAGHLVEYRSAIERLDFIQKELPDLIDSALDIVFAISNLEESDFYRFIAVTKWICENQSKEGTLIRKIPVRGVDTRWFEIHRPLLLDFIRNKLQLNPSRKDLLQIGLVPPPALVRICILDRVLRNKVGGLSYLAATISDLEQLNLKPQRVVFMDNLSTVLSLPEVPGTVVILNNGINASDVASISWVANAKTLFMGNIDLRSFALLNNLRIHLPKIESALMDLNTLIENKDLWSQDNDVVINTMPGALNDIEAIAFRALAENYYGTNIRLSQERMPLDLICKALGVNSAFVENTIDNSQIQSASLTDDDSDE